MGITNWMVLNWFKVKYQFDWQDKWSLEFQQWHITKEWTSKIGVGAMQIILDSAKTNFSIWECLKYYIIVIQHLFEAQLKSDVPSLMTYKL